MTKKQDIFSISDDGSIRLLRDKVGSWLFPRYIRTFCRMALFDSSIYNSVLNEVYKNEL